MELLTKKETIELFEKHFGYLTSKITSLEKEVSKLTENSKMMLRSEVARQLGLSWHQVANISYNAETEKPSKRKQLPYHKIGDSIRYNPQDIIDLKEKIGG